MSESDWPEYLDRAKTAEYLTERGFSVTVSGLAKLAMNGTGPRYAKNGRKTLYARADIDSWLAGVMSKAHASTAAHAHARR